MNILYSFKDFNKIKNKNILIHRMRKLTWIIFVDTNVEDENTLKFLENLNEAIHSKYAGNIKEEKIFF